MLTCTPSTVMRWSLTLAIAPLAAVSEMPSALGVVRAVLISTVCV